RADADAGLLRNTVGARPVEAFPHQNASSRFDQDIDRRARSRLRGLLAGIRERFARHVFASRMRVANTSDRSYSACIARKCNGGSTIMTQPSYLQLIEVKRWADRGLYAAVTRNFDQLSPEEGSIMLRILDHIHTVDRIFQHHLQ